MDECFRFYSAGSQTVRLGSFRTLQHQVRGDIFAIDEKTIRIENFTYDGVGAGKFLDPLYCCHSIYDFVAHNVNF